MNARVMLVDDEPAVLSGYKRSLRKRFDITTCESAGEALQAVADSGPFSVVVSDMRMPEMSGVELFRRLKEIAPESVRVMLTGNSDQQTAIDAVNQGDVFRFLNKPCSVDEMSHALEVAIEQHRLLVAEQELLEKTVRGSILALTETLSLSDPELFGRVNRYRTHMLAFAEPLNVTVDWVFEAVPLLSLIGTVSLDKDVVRKALAGGPLTPEEAKEFDQHPALGAAVIDHIPRMERLAESIRHQRTDYSVGGASIPIEARILRVVFDWDRLQSAGTTLGEIASQLEDRTGHYDPEVLNVLRAVLEGVQSAATQSVRVKHLTENMRLADDVVTQDGKLLVAKGQAVTAAVRNGLANFYRRGLIEDSVLVMTDGE